MSGAERRLLAREWFLSAVVAAVLAGVLLWLGPPGVDLAAHAYQRTFLLQHGFAVWNNFWYAGRYSFVTYSFIYYPLAAVLGIKLLAVLSIGIAALAFALVVWQEWGPSARFSSRTFAILWPGIVLSAAFPFALGAMFALLAIAALQRGHRRSFAVLLFLTLLASPLALLLLVLVLAGGALGPTPRRATVVVIAAAVALELALRRLFPEQGQFPFSVADLVPGVAFGLLGIAVTARVPGARRLFGLFAVFLAALLVAFIVPSDLGANVERLKFMAIPLALLAATRRAEARPADDPARRGRRLLEHLRARAHRAGGRRRPGAQRRLLAARDRLPAPEPEPVLPRRGGRHDRALARRLPAGRRHPDRARLVPPERLPAERAALRPHARGARLRVVAAWARRPLRRALRRAAGLQLARRGGAHPLRPLRARSRSSRACT